MLVPLSLPASLFHSNPIVFLLSRFPISAEQIRSRAGETESAGGICFVPLVRKETCIRSTHTHIQTTCASVHCAFIPVSVFVTVASASLSQGNAEMRCKKVRTDRDPLEDLKIWHQESGHCEVSYMLFPAAVLPIIRLSAGPLAKSAGDAKEEELH